MIKERIGDFPSFHLCSTYKCILYLYTGIQSVHLERRQSGQRDFAGEIGTLASQRRNLPTPIDESAVSPARRQLQSLSSPLQQIRVQRLFRSRTGFRRAHVTASHFRAHRGHPISRFQDRRWHQRRTLVDVDVDVVVFPFLGLARNVPGFLVVVIVVKRANEVSAMAPTAESRPCRHRLSTSYACSECS